MRNASAGRDASSCVTIIHRRRTAEVLGRKEANISDRGIRPPYAIPSMERRAPIDCAASSMTGFAPADASFDRSHLAEQVHRHHGLRLRRPRAAAASGRMLYVAGSISTNTGGANVVNRARGRENVNGVVITSSPAENRARGPEQRVGAVRSRPRICMRQGSNLRPSRSGRPRMNSAIDDLQSRKDFIADRGVLRRRRSSRGRA